MTKQKPKANQISDSFFEAFREVGGQTKAKPKNQPKFEGEFQQQPVNNFAEQFKQKELDIRRQERVHAQRIIRQEKLVFSRKQVEVKRQITSIQEELQLLVKEAGLVSQEVQVAVEQVVVNPGIYHVNFFNKIRQLIILLRKKVADSRTWMHETNSRANRRLGYWGKVKKSGTKFMLSQERYMATQAG